ncbi:thiocillin family RiPP [Streptomyces pacificus]|uniref:Thiocillin family RiPP n=1 Tax=Streptomyces pacificus TaxID=2705029 RepID=A0A6A0B299_9ACTN|nr:thiocillin family RiPP [Streptomyces pacificus]GFH39429.1 thiocillin family RiPP [Streptomyces pacificus]
MNDVDLRLEQEAPEIEVLADAQSPSSTVGTGSSVSTAGGTAGTIGTVGCG